LLALCAVTPGCVWVGWGTFPEAHGDGVEPLEKVVERNSGKSPGYWTFRSGTAVVVSPALEAEISVDTYAPSMTFVGFLVPVIPIPFNIGELQQLRVGLKLTGGTGFVRAESLRVRIGDREYAPRGIEYIHPGALWGPAPDEPIPAAEHGTLRYDFRYLPSPREPFSIEVEGLPRVEYESKFRWLAALEEQ
jgi:hypothetical protein